MEKYHKIETLLKRDSNNNYKTVIEGIYSLPIFDYLQDINWRFEEKVDGTNIRIIWDHGNLEFRGKSDNAQIPQYLHEKLNNLFNPQLLYNIFGNESVVCIYGEGYGCKINGGGKYISDDADFILFDVNINGFWIDRPKLEEFADKLYIDIVPVVGEGNLKEAVSFAKRGFYSEVSQNETFIAEGLVLKPSIQLLDKRGNRIISKIKHNDFTK